ncbi:hypothetical protein NDU88_002766 [Pleurodeles waltl]|uniref:Uncharacterized protein n=1 Tax=Pleurodeles waltl TaxID=8319 RepID=A0AAV7UCG1_PLEWA|nr:hypothetical protein NDU88_002766 [Pleurodeles waltl]
MLQVPPGTLLLVPASARSNLRSPALLLLPPSSSYPPSVLLSVFPGARNSPGCSFDAGSPRGFAASSFRSGSTSTCCVYGRAAQHRPVTPLYNRTFFDTSYSPYPTLTETESHFSVTER